MYRMFANAQATRFMKTSKLKPNTFRTEISHLDWPFVFAAIATIILYVQIISYYIVAVSIAAIFRLRCGFFSSVALCAFILRV